MRADDNPPLDFVAIDASVLLSPLVPESETLNALEPAVVELRGVRNVFPLVAFHGGEVGVGRFLSDHAARLDQALFDVVSTHVTWRWSAQASARKVAKRRGGVGTVWWVSNDDLAPRERRGWQGVADEVVHFPVELGAPVDWRALVRLVRSNAELRVV